jgi:type I restriction enzyme R subunit
MNSISENDIEQIAIGYLKTLGYNYVWGPAISPDLSAGASAKAEGEQQERQYNEVVLVKRLRSAIDTLNPNLPTEAKEDARKKALRAESPNQLRASLKTLPSYL